jgi:hypothetical protein
VRSLAVSVMCARVHTRARAQGTSESLAALDLSSHPAALEDVDYGQPCLVCKTCPGFMLHRWRKVATPRRPLTHSPTHTQTHPPTPTPTHPHPHIHPHHPSPHPTTDRPTPTPTAAPPPHTHTTSAHLPPAHTSTCCTSVSEVQGDCPHRL